VSRAARGHVCRGLAHTQSEVRIGAKQHWMVDGDIVKRKWWGKTNSLR
jgi:hypothetical protein